LLLLITFGFNFYNSTLKTTNKLIAELKGATLPELTCAQKTGTEQDLCYLIIVIAQQDSSTRLCENIKSDFYKMTCYRAIP
jgi:hypothetical protein